MTVETAVAPSATATFREVYPGWSDRLDGDSPGAPGPGAAAAGDDAFA